MEPSRSEPHSEKGLTRTWLRKFMGVAIHTLYTF